MRSITLTFKQQMPRILNIKMSQRNFFLQKWPSSYSYHGLWRGCTEQPALKPQLIFCSSRVSHRCFSVSLSCENKDPGDPNNFESFSRVDDIQNFLAESDEPSEDPDDWEEPGGVSSFPEVPTPKKGIDPASTSVVLFPGQGSQFVGMASGLLQYPNVNEMFEMAGDLLKYDLLNLCLNGPKEMLDKTVFCQLAVFVTSLAAVEKLKFMDEKALENCVAAAGFSVGELAALVFSGALSFDEALELIKVRAEEMQRASDLVRSGMLSVVGSRKTKFHSICGEAVSHCHLKGVQNPVCQIATYLFPNGRVIAGNVEALDYIQERTRSFDLRLVRPIYVSGAFHTPLMTPALPNYKKALDKVTIEQPLISVYSNVDGKPYRKPEGIRKLLQKQLVSPVRWEQAMHNLYSRSQGQHFPKTFEVGPGKQLGTILKQINGKAFKEYFAVEVGKDEKT